MTEVQVPLVAIQIGINSCDLAGSLRLFSELGFANAGGHMIWGKPMSIQGLPPSARGQMYWLVGRQRRVQLEFFHLTNPAQRPQAEDWRCCDLGWNRIGIAVPDLDAAKAVLAEWDIAVTGESETPGEPRRLVFREPFVRCYVEVFEDGDAIPGGRALRHFDVDPAVVYAMASVSDLESARTYYVETLGMKIAEGVVIHRPEHEAMWGLEGASTESFVVDGGGFLIEVVHYLDPVGRPKPDDYFVGDQGLMNIAVGSFEIEPALEAISRARKQGYKVSDLALIADAGGAYVLEPEREVEIGGMPEHMEEAFGYVPRAPFFGA